MIIAYADPPYPGQSKKHYGDHPDYAGEVDHAILVQQLRDYDAWILHTSSPALRRVLWMCEEDVRVLSWGKSFCAFKANVPLAYAWEPVIIKVGRKQVTGGDITMRDFIFEPMTMRRGLVGAKPERVVHWALRAVGAEPSDELVDLFPGSGAVQRAWESFRDQGVLV